MEKILQNVHLRKRKSILITSLRQNFSLSQHSRISLSNWSSIWQRLLKKWYGAICYNTI